MTEIKRELPLEGIFTPDIGTGRADTIITGVPINGYNGYIRPQDNRAARELGDKCAADVVLNRIADFERTPEYCAKHGEDSPDLMVHVSSFVIIDGIIYMTYYANIDTDAEDHRRQQARLAFCPEDNPEDMTVVELQRVGDTLDGRKITDLYDTILMYKGGDEIYLLWTAAPDGNYHRLWCTFNIKTRTLSPVRPNRFRVGKVTNDFSITGMKAALTASRIPFKSMWSDIGIMQKLSTRVENGVTMYYTGAYSGNFNCIIKSADLITWEYVSAPSFANFSQWENAVYVIGDRLWYFVRQIECAQGFLTSYDLNAGAWERPVLVADTQSRSDFFVWEDELYLVHAPIDRNGFGILRIDRYDPSKSVPVLVADMKDSLFYPFTVVYGDELYISYTVARKHIRLSRISLPKYFKKD